MINIINMRMRISQIQSTKSKEFTTATILTKVTAEVNFCHYEENHQRLPR